MPGEFEYGQPSADVLLAKARTSIFGLHANCDIVKMLASVTRSLWRGMLSLASGWPGRPRLAILLYHRVLDKLDPLRAGEPTAHEFEAQMRCISRFFNPISFTEGIQRVRTGSLPPRAVAITFDDGYEDNVSVALPILNQHKLSATFFVSTAYLDGGVMWNDLVIDCIRDTTRPDLDLSDIGLGRYELSDLASRISAVGKVIPSLKYRTPAERHDLAVVLAKRSGVNSTSKMMTSMQVRNLRAAGMELGAHTRSHPILASLTREEAIAEIQQGKLDLEKVVGEPIRVFAYPNGKVGRDYGERDVEIVRELGFEGAVSTEWGVAESKSDLFQLPRFTPWDRSQWKYMLRMGWIYRRPL